MFHVEHRKAGWAVFLFQTKDESNEAGVPQTEAL